MNIHKGIRRLYEADYPFGRTNTQVSRIRRTPKWRQTAVPCVYPVTLVLITGNPKVREREGLEDTLEIDTSPPAAPHVVPLSRYNINQDWIASGIHVPCTDAVHSGGNNNPAAAPDATFCEWQSLVRKKNTRGG